METSLAWRFVLWKIAEEKTVVVIKCAESGRFAELLYASLIGNLAGLSFRLRQRAFAYPVHEDAFCDAGDGVVIAEVSLNPVEAW